MKQLRPGDKFLRGHNVRLIDQNNQQVGIVTFETAMARAQQAGLNLVLVPTRAEPPVTRIMDFGKYQFDEAKRAREARRNQVQAKVKEVKFFPNIDDNDFNIKLKKAKEFLTHGDKVRVVLTIRGRENAHPEIYMGIFNRFLEELAEISVQESAPKRMGKTLATLLTVKPQYRVAKQAQAPKGKDDERDDSDDSAAPQESAPQSSAFELDPDQI